MGEVADMIREQREEAVDPNLGKLRDLARRIPAHNVQIDSDSEQFSGPRYRIYVDSLAVKGAWWTYDQAWCILVGMRAA